LFGRKEVLHSKCIVKITESSSPYKFSRLEQNQTLTREQSCARAILLKRREIALEVQDGILQNKKKIKLSANAAYVNRRSY